MYSIDDYGGEGRKRKKTDGLQENQLEYTF